MERLMPDEADQLLSLLAPRNAEHADSLLDLRDLLIHGGHPGKCVKCFFAVASAAEDAAHGAVTRLRKWLEHNIVLQVTTGGNILETIPFAPKPGADLESYCHSTIRTIRLDRAYHHQAITIRFDYRRAA